MLATTQRRYSPPPSQQGLSLIELMISITIGLILLVGITSLIVQQSATRDELEKSSRQIENGRYASTILFDDIEHAGFYGQYYTLNTATLPATLPDPCQTSPSSLASAIPIFVQGYYYSSGASPISCINSANLVPGTNILVIRRVDTLSDANSLNFTQAAAAPLELFLQSSASSAVVNTGAGASATTFPLVNTKTNAPAPLRPFLVHIYYVSPCSTMANGSTCQASDDNGHPIPTLKRLELSSNGTFTTTPLVEGIQSMRFDYGIDTDVPSNGYPDVYCLDPNSSSNCSTTSYVPLVSPANWPNVMAIRVNILARNIDTTTGYADTKQYQLSSISGVSSTIVPASGDGYKRHVFSALVRITNPSGQRAQQ